MRREHLTSNGVLNQSVILKNLDGNERTRDLRREEGFALDKRVIGVHHIIKETRSLPEYVGTDGSSSGCAAPLKVIVRNDQILTV